MAVIGCVQQSLSRVNELPCWPFFASQRNGICIADDVARVVQRCLTDSALKRHRACVVPLRGCAVVADTPRDRCGRAAHSPCSRSFRMTEFDLNTSFGPRGASFPLTPLLSTFLSAGLTRVELSVQSSTWSFTRRTRKCGCLWPDSNAAGLTDAEHGDPSGLSPGHNKSLGWAWGGVRLKSKALM